MTTTTTIHVTMQTMTVRAKGSGARARVPTSRRPRMMHCYGASLHHGRYVSVFVHVALVAPALPATCAGARSAAFAAHLGVAVQYLGGKQGDFVLANRERCPEGRVVQAQYSKQRECQQALGVWIVGGRPKIVLPPAHPHADRSVIPHSSSHNQTVPKLYFVSGPRQRGCSSAFLRNLESFVI